MSTKKLEKSEASPSGVQKGNTNMAENRQRSGDIVLSWADGIKLFFFRMGGIIVFVPFVCSAFGSYYALLGKNPFWTAIWGLIGSLFASLLAAWLVVAFVNRLRFSVPDEEKRKVEIKKYIGEVSQHVAQNIFVPKPATVDLSHLEKRLLSLESKIEQWWKHRICEFHEVCPLELRDLREILISIQESTHSGVADVAVLLLGERLKRFVVQLGAVCDGEWRIDFGDINIQTEADLIYNIVTESLLKKVPGISIYASTVIHFLHWWLTGPGLSYLEAEKQKTVDRVFLFPKGAVGSVFEDYIQESAILQKAVQQEKNRNWDGQTIFSGDFSQIFKEQAIIVLLLNHCIGDNVYVMTPELCTPPLGAWAQNRTNVDIAILQQNLPNKLDQFLFCIEINCIATPSEILRSDKSYIYFSPDEINQRINQLRKLIEESRGLKLNLEAIIEESPKLQKIKQKTDNIIRSRQKLIDVQDRLIGLWQDMKEKNDDKKGQRNG